MTRVEFTQLVSEIRYKPGWQLKCWWDLTVVTLQITANVLAIDGSGMIQVAMNRPFYLGELERLSREHLIDIIFEFIVQAEYHEAREWFRVGSARPFDPHVKKASVHANP